jgi:SP family myo-inositol transporter-like MFS transporter 13
MSTEQVYLDEKAAGEHIEETRNLDSIEDTTPGAFVWLCAAATAIGGLLFGYDTGVISGVLVVLGSDLDGRPLSASDKELITSLCAAGGLCGALVAGCTADKFGRKPAIWFASILFTIGALVQATSFSMAQMSVGRFLIGLGVGSASTVCEALLILLMRELFTDKAYRSCRCTLQKFRHPGFVVA